VQGELDEYRKVLGSTPEHEDMVGVPILVLVNKQDREDCVEVVRMVFKSQGGNVGDSRVYWSVC
jgi:ADP-ribosylation factor related protein 1